ncbi:unnamed protein product [Toxocara canis]|uniref:Uncharacterized protein n=1 Tax=Toxocara canis TaxID=6265 RepID=A0A183UBH4_TOXCA|nr:unnamed protein product [Toxocara canis]
MEPELWDGKQLPITPSEMDQTTQIWIWRRLEQSCRSYFVDPGKNDVNRTGCVENGFLPPYFKPTKLSAEFSKSGTSGIRYFRDFQCSPSYFGDFELPPSYSGDFQCTTASPMESIGGKDFVGISCLLRHETLEMM